MKKVRDGYKMTELGEIPEEWEVKSISDIGKFQGGYAFKSEEYTDEGVKLIRITNVQQGNLNWEDKCYLPKSFEEKFQDYIVNVNDVMLAMTRPIISTGIKACKVKKQDVPSLLNQRVGRFILSNGLDSGFLYQYIFTDYFINKVNELSSTTGQPNISSKQIESIKIIVPLIREQKKISLILSSIDEQIENTDNLIERTNELKKGLMQRLFTKGIGHDRFKETELGEIPEEWEVVSIKDVADIISGGTPSTKKAEYWDNGTILWATPTDITASGKYIRKTINCITENGLKNSSANLLPIGSVLMTSRATIGERCINTVDMSTNQGFKSFICKEKLYNEFMYYLIDIIREGLISLAGGSTFLEVSKSSVEDYKIALPMLKEQQKISLILSLVDEQIDKYELNKEKLQELKKGLMQKLLTGKIRV